MEEFKRLQRNLIHKGRIFDYYQDTMETPEGKTVVWDTIEHNGAAAVVPVREDGKLLLVRQYRNPVERQTLEIPAGKRDSVNESTYDCVVRELEEETGYRSENIELLIRFVSAIAYSSEKIDIYVAKDLKPTAQHLDEDEFIDVVAYSTDELKTMIFDGTIQDSKTIAAIMAYIVKYEK